jgi:hypothetical protein
MSVTFESIRPRLLAIIVAAAALTVACGEGTGTQLPTAPSALPGSTAILSDEAADTAATAASESTFETLGRGGNGNGNGGGNGNGRGNGNGNGNGGGNDRPEDDERPGRSGEATVVGFVAARSANTITVNGVTVAPALNAAIRHGNRILTLADIEVGDHVQARGSMEGTTLVATEIKVQDTGRDNDDVDEVEVEGTIAGLSSTSTCPLVSFMIGATRVTTSAATAFDDVTCATLANNLLVEVEGIRQGDGSILARKVEAEAGADEVEGFVFEFSGVASCSNTTFRVGPTLSLSTRVVTNSSTSFSCATLANGVRVEVEGTRQADGSILAASVEPR